MQRGSKFAVMRANREAHDERLFRRAILEKIAHAEEATWRHERARSASRPPERPAFSRDLAALRRPGFSDTVRMEMDTRPTGAANCRPWWRRIWGVA